MYHVLFAVKGIFMQWGIGGRDGMGFRLRVIFSSCAEFGRGQEKEISYFPKRKINRIVRVLE